MTRGIGGAEFASELPEAAVAVAGLVTQLGDTWFVLVAVGALFVLGTRSNFSAHGTRGRSLADDPRRACAVLFALAVGAYSLTTVLKYAFGLPRPPGAATATPPSWLPAVAHAAYESMVTGDGYGFPSGHALQTTVVYGGAALALDVWDRHRRLVAAGVVVALVGASRVALGVHYAVDVAVGIVAGVLFLAATVRLTCWRPVRALALSTGLGALAVGVAGTLESTLTLAAAATGLAVWIVAARSPRLGASASER